jgi:hypothetical protein
MTNLREVRIPILIFILIIIPSTGFGFNDLNQIFTEANFLYQEERYQEALDLYKLVEESGIRNKTLYYNIANTYMHINPIQLGEAILYYNKALLYDPADEKIRYNLDIARSLVISDYPSSNGDNNTILSNIFNIIYTHLNLDILTCLIIVLLTGISISIIVYFLSMKKNTLLLKICVILIIVFIILFVIFAIRFRFDIMVKYGVVTEEEIKVYILPSEKQQVLLSLSEGVELEVIDKTSQEWFYISLPGGIKGYVNSKKIEIINNF